MLRNVKNEMEREAILVCTDLGVQENRVKIYWEKLTFFPNPEDGFG
jgi:hypothetical protein